MDMDLFQKCVDFTQADEYREKGIFPYFRELQSRQDTEVIAREAIGLLIEAIESPETHKPRQITVEGMLAEGETLSSRS